VCPDSGANYAFRVVGAISLAQSGSGWRRERLEARIRALKVELKNPTAIWAVLGSVVDLPGRFENGALEKGYGRKKEREVVLEDCQDIIETVVSEAIDLIVHSLLQVIRSAKGQWVGVLLHHNVLTV
jgi:hypothetical protein